MEEPKHGAVSLKRFNHLAIKGSDDDYASSGEKHHFINGYYYTSALNKKEAIQKIKNYIINNDFEFEHVTLYSEMNIPKKILKKKVSEITKAEAREFNDCFFLSATSIKGKIIDKIKNGFECAVCGDMVNVKPYEETVYINFDKKRYVFCSDDCKSIGQDGSLHSSYIDLDMKRRGGNPSIYLIFNEELNKYYVGKTTGTPFYRGNAHINNPDSSAVGKIIEKYQNLKGGCFKVLEMCESDVSDIDVFKRENYWIDVIKNSVGIDNMLNRTALKAFENSKEKIMKHNEKQNSTQISLFDDIDDCSKPWSLKEV